MMSAGRALIRYMYHFQNAMEMWFIASDMVLIICGVMYMILIRSAAGEDAPAARAIEVLPHGSHSAHLTQCPLQPCTLRTVRTEWC